MKLNLYITKTLKAHANKKVNVRFSGVPELCCIFD